MCNAQNHPPGCQCGWGGGWHSGGYGTGLHRGAFSAYRGSLLFYGVHDDLTVRTAPNSNPPKMRSVSSPIADDAAIRGSWTQPNSKCPVCGAAVYCYQPESGGRILFDQLGPPWPKHECIDHWLDSPPAAKGSSGSGRGWADAGWVALTSVQTTQIGDRGLTTIRGYGGNSPRRFYVRTEIDLDLHIVRFRSHGHDAVELSVLARGPESKSWLIASGMACDKRFPPPGFKLLVDREIPDSSAPLAPGTSDAPRCEEAARPLVADERQEASDARNHTERTELREVDRRIQALVNELVALEQLRQILVKRLLGEP